MKTFFGAMTIYTCNGKSLHVDMLINRHVEEENEQVWQNRDSIREKLLSEDPDMTDAEMYELLGYSYEPCYTICFNQDREMLYSDLELAGRAGFAVQGKEVKTLHVLIFDNFDDWLQMEKEGMNEQRRCRQGCHCKGNPCRVIKICRFQSVNGVNA